MAASNRKYLLQYLLLVNFFGGTVKVKKSRTPKFLMESNDFEDQPNSFSLNNCDVSCGQVRKNTELFWKIWFYFLDLIFWASMVLMKDLDEYSYYDTYYQEKQYNYNYENSQDLRIVNGYDPPNRPWQALIIVYDKKHLVGSQCGGALINRRLIRGT